MGKSADLINAAVTGVAQPGRKLRRYRVKGGAAGAVVASLLTSQNPLHEFMDYEGNPDLDTIHDVVKQHVTLIALDASYVGDAFPVYTCEVAGQVSPALQDVITADLERTFQCAIQVSYEPTGSNTTIKVALPPELPMAESIERPWIKAQQEREKRGDNPYKSSCPACGKPAVSSCRCSGPHTLEDLKAGHGLSCSNGHHWSKQSDGSVLCSESKGSVLSESRTIQERNWSLALGINMEEYGDLDPDDPDEFQQIKDDILRKLRLNLPRVRELPGVDILTYESVIDEVEMSGDVEDIDAALSMLYDWGDANNVFTGGEGLPQELGDVSDELRDRLKEARLHEEPEMRFHDPDPAAHDEAAYVREKRPLFDLDFSVYCPRTKVQSGPAVVSFWPTWEPTFKDWNVQVDMKFNLVGFPGNKFRFGDHRNTVPIPEKYWPALNSTLKPHGDWRAQINETVRLTKIILKDPDVQDKVDKIRRRILADVNQISTKFGITPPERVDRMETIDVPNINSNLKLIMRFRHARVDNNNPVKSTELIGQVALNKKPDEKMIRLAGRGGYSIFVLVNPEEEAQLRQVIADINSRGAARAAAKNFGGKAGAREYLNDLKAAQEEVEEAVDQTMARQDLRDAPVREKPSRQQAHMNRAYARWRDGGELAGKSQEDFIGALKDPEKLAVEFGNLNYQVCNGGYLQWITNGYADVAINDLLEYCDEYQGEYPTLRRLREQLRELVDAYEDAPGRYDSIDDWVSHDSASEIEDAIYDQNWSKLDDLLGGTDLDARKFNQYRRGNMSGWTVEPYEGTPDPVPEYDASRDLRNELHQQIVGAEDEPAAKVTMWSYRILDDDHGEIAYDAAESEGYWFGSEEEAEAAGEEALKTIDFDSLSDEALRHLDDVTCEELAAEYSKHGGNEIEILLDRLDEDFYTFNERMLVELSQLLDDHFPESTASRAKAKLKELWATVKNSAKRIISRPRRFVSKVSRAGKAAATAAAQAFRQESAITRLTT